MAIKQQKDIKVTQYQCLMHILTGKERIRWVFRQMGILVLFAVVWFERASVPASHHRFEPALRPPPSSIYRSGGQQLPSNGYQMVKTRKTYTISIPYKHLGRGKGRGGSVPSNDFPGSIHGRGCPERQVGAAPPARRRILYDDPASSHGFIQ